MTLRKEGAAGKTLTKLARSVLNLRAKQVPKKAEESGLTGAIKRIVKKVTG
ncbi:MAG: hypothetical protein V7609_1415 [Verrucomicrobiota bacterium]